MYDLCEKVHYKINLSSKTILAKAAFLMIKNYLFISGGDLYGEKYLKRFSKINCIF